MQLYPIIDIVTSTSLSLEPVVCRSEPLVGGRLETHFEVLTQNTPPLDPVYAVLNFAEMPRGRVHRPCLCRPVRAVQRWNE